MSMSRTSFEAICCDRLAKLISPADSNKIEVEANTLDNDIELIVFGSKDENQVKETLLVLDRTALILKSRVVL